LGEFGFSKNRFTYVLRNKVGAVREPPLLKGAYEANIIYDVWHQRVYNPKGFEIKDSEVIIDIGAHKGIFSVYAALQAEDVRVFSYEPVPLNFELLTHNIRLNGLTQRVKAYNFAVAAENKIKTLFVRDGTKDSATHSFYQRTKGDKPIEVKCITLQDILAEHGIDKCHLLKLDCQGAEYEILLNAPKELLHRIERIAMEYHKMENFKVEVGARHTVSLLKEHLQNVGFEVRIKPPYLYANSINKVDSKQ
jgi:FkbM family methyltransferase